MVQGKLSILVLLCLVIWIQEIDSKVVEQAEWNGCCVRCPRLEWVVRRPTHTRYAKICQYGKSGNTPYFATFFDKENKIPVFSSFKIDHGRSVGKRPTSFLNEAQLVNTSHEKHIRELRKIAHRYYHRNLTLATEDIGKSQAINNDYRHSGYDRGHLNPAAGHDTRESMVATFTFTNVIPQVSTFNKRCWSNVEQNTRKFVESECAVNNRVVVGAIPGQQQLKERVNIPAFMWSYVDCGQDKVAFVAPNINNTEIERNRLLTVLFLHDDDDKNNDLLNFLNIVTADGNGTPEYRISNMREQFRIRNLQMENAPVQAGRILTEGLSCTNETFYFRCMCKEQDYGVKAHS